jgi:hypothetical protein
VILTQRLLLSVVAIVALGASACSTVTKPIRPTDPLGETQHLTGVRFDGQLVHVREPGSPVATSRAWLREVGNYTAKTLNTLVEADPTAPAAQTVVVFDQASRGAIEIGAWREMTIEIISTLPSGQVVRSEPVTGHVDSTVEQLALQGTAATASCVDVTVPVASLVFFLGQSFLTPEQWIAGCGCLIGMAIGGLLLHAAERSGAFLVAASEETRWSNMYLEALKQHAVDVRNAQRGAPPPARPAPAAPAPAAPAAPAPADPPPSGSPPPPAPMDPADPYDDGPTAY